MSVLRDEPLEWPVHSTRDVFRGGAPFAVRQDEVSRPGHHEDRFSRIVVEHPGAVIVLAVDEDERALVLRQYRHAAGMRLVELPAGLLDLPGEDPLVAAQRELLEEGALEAGQWTHLSSIYSSPGISNERIDIYLARGLRPVPDRGGFELEHEEADMTLHWVPVAELVRGVLEMRLLDGPMAVGLLTYALTRGDA